MASRHAGLKRITGARAAVRFARGVAGRLEHALFPYVTTQDGCRLRVHPPGRDAIVSTTLRRNGVWESSETEIFKRELKPGTVVADVGANIGYYAVLAGRILGTAGAVHAFEPAPDNYKLLRDNIAANRCDGIVVPVNKAAGETAGTVDVYLSATNRGDHRIYRGNVFAGDLDRSSVKAALVTLDEYFASTGVLPTLIKLDVQGAELGVIRGMRSILAEQRSLCVLTEVWAKGLSEAGGSGREYVGELAGAGFSLSLIGERGELHSVTPERAVDLAERCPSWTGIDLLCRR